MPVHSFKRNMKKLFVLLCIPFFSWAQITPNPPIKKKSTNDTFINKIELTDKYTIVFMQFVSKSAEEQLKDYFNARPEEKEEMRQLDPFSRGMILQQMMQGLEKDGSSTISIQPSSFLRAPNGEKYKFLKAENIPVAPDRMSIKPSQKHFFRVYFEPLKPGIQSVDLIENENARDEGGTTYWNFYGISVNNPAPGEKEEMPISRLTAGNTKLFGKVLDFDSNEPIRAKVVCKKEDNAIDSIRTSGTGYYEFLLPRAYTTYVISAEGYATLEQTIDLSRNGGIEELENDFYLEKLSVDKVEEPLKAEESPKLEITVDKKIELKDLYFITGKDEILPSSYDELNELVKLLKDDPNLRILIEGHTDNQGDARKNKILSIDRALAVRNYLVSKGIDAERLEFTGHGDTKPIVPNDDPISRQKNRRVEISVLD